MNPDVCAKAQPISCRAFEANGGSLGGGRGIVPVDPNRFIETSDDQFHIPIPIEVAGGGRITHAEVVEPPALADVLEIQVATVGKGEILLFAGRMGFVVVPLGLANMI